MRLARVIGTVTATVKQASLTGGTFLVTDVIDGAGNVISPAVIAVDTDSGTVEAVAEGILWRLAAERLGHESNVEKGACA